MLRAATYSRYSSDRQRAASIDDQDRICLARIMRECWEHVARYADEEMSGAIADRPDYRRMLADATAGKFDMLVIESLDRVSRSLKETAGLYEHLSYYGVTLYALDDGVITDLHVGLKGTMDQRFLKDLGAKVRRGLEGRVLQGKNGGGICYGYKPVRQVDARGEPVRGDREIDEGEAAIVRRIFAEFAAGIGPREIARRLNADGVPGPRAELWSESAIRGWQRRGTGILNNELYVGRLIWNKQRFARHPQSGRRQARMNPEARWVTVDVPALRIVDDTTWEEVKARQAEIAARIGAKSAPVAGRREKHLLGGLLTCAACGGPFTIKGRDQYGCRNHRLHRSCGNAVALDRTHLEARVVAGIKARMLEPEIVRAYMAEYVAETNRLNAARDRGRTAREAELREVERKIGAMLDVLEQGIIGPNAKRRLEELEARQAKLQAELASLPAAPAPVLHPGFAAIYRQKVAELARTIEDSESKPAGVAALRALVDRVAIAGDGTVELQGALAALLALGEQKQTPAGGGAVDLNAIGGCGSPNRPMAFTFKLAI